MCTGTNKSHWETTCNGENMEENKLNGAEKSKELRSSRRGDMTY